MQHSISRVKKAIEDIKNGRMVIMMDDEDRENEGDLVYAGVFTTPEKVNFMLKEARGLICAPVTKEIASRLELYPMVKENDSNHETAFTISIDSASADTGISAFERDDCLKKLSDPLVQAKDFVRPGHIFPLIAKDGGVLVRTGHTEGSVDLCKLAGLAPVSVICEIVKDDGAMARKDDLELFAAKHDLSIIYISDIVSYRLTNENLVKKIGKTQESELMGAKVNVSEYSDHLGRKHKVIEFYKTHSLSNVRFHNIGLDSDLILGEKKLEVLISSIEYLKSNGGVLILLDTKTISKEQAKEFGVGAQILKDLGVKQIRLLTTHSDTEFVGLSGFGLDVIEKILLS